MQIDKPIQAIILCFIGVLGSFKLMTSGIISEASFVVLVGLSCFVSLIIFFSNRLSEFNLRKLSAKIRAIDAQVAKTTEPKTEEITLSVSGELPKLVANIVMSDETTDLVIKAIGGTEYTWRYLENIVKDSGLPLDVARDKLNWLIVNDFAAEFDGVDGKVYALSSKGQSTFSRIIKNQT